MLRRVYSYSTYFIDVSVWFSVLGEAEAEEAVWPRLALIDGLAGPMARAPPSSISTLLALEFVLSPSTFLLNCC